jgi:hypothetical protein
MLYPITNLSELEASLNRSLWTATVYICCLPIALALFSSNAFSADVQNVHVDNLPETLQVRGSVSIDSPVSHVQFLKKEAILVAPSRRAEPAEMTHAGTVSADGFTSIILSLQGEVKSGSPGAGTAGVLLVPDEEPILRAFREARRTQYVIECSCPMKTGDSTYFNADQVQQRLSFPRYRIYLYNTTGKTLEANLYMTLTH